jgi:signal transduction histidine kinase
MRSLLAAPVVLVGGSVVMGALVLGVTGHGIFQAREAALRHAQETVRTLAHSLAEHASRTLEAVNLALQNAEYGVEAAGPNLDREALHAMLRHRAEASQHVRSIFVFDAEGRPIVESGTHPPRPLDPTKREYFTIHRDNPDIGLFIGRPVMSRLADAWMFPASRRIEGPDGSFAGVIIAALEPRHFSDFYAALETGQGERIRLLEAGGTILAQHSAGGSTQAAGDPSPNREILSERFRGESSGIFMGAPGSEDEGRIVAFRRVGDLPLVVTASIPEAGVLQEWRGQAFRNGAMSAALALAGVWVAVALGREIRRRAQLARDLASERDRAERERAAAERANRAKSAFLATMSHELRTPLNSIIGFSEMIQQEAFGPLGDQRYLEYAGDINVSGMHLLRLINSVLDLSRIEAGEAAVDRAPTDLAGIVRGAVRAVAPSAAAKDLSLECRISASPLVLADGVMLRQAVANVLANAVKFTAPGGQVAVSLDAADGKAEVEVRDTGVGISPEDLPHVFEPFRQASATLARRYEGTGLGLTLARRFVELNGGTIGIESEVGRGTSVLIRLAAEAMSRTPHPDEGRVPPAGERPALLDALPG